MTKWRRFATVRVIFHPAIRLTGANSAIFVTIGQDTVNWMKTLRAKDAKGGFGRLIDLARAEPLAVWPAAQVIREFMRAYVAGQALCRMGPDEPEGRSRQHFHAEGAQLGTKSTTVVRVSIREANLKRRMRRHLTSLGFQKTREGVLAPLGNDKDVTRTVHGVQRDDRLAANRQFISDKLPKLLKHFASGADVDPTRISPALERIDTATWQGDLFRLASLTWSVPVSNGFGRRLRYLVWDKQNEKLLGIIAIGDPIFNLSVRDNLIDWNVEDRGKRLVNMMDAYVLGALPPYNMLLGGKASCLSAAHQRYLR